MQKFLNKISFLKLPLRIYSVNVTKSANPVDLVIFTEEILDGKGHFCAMDTFDMTKPIHKIEMNKNATRCNSRDDLLHLIFTLKISIF